MTEDQKRDQKAHLLLEYQEAGEELAHLNERARRVSERINDVSSWLNKTIQGDIESNEAGGFIRKQMVEYSEALNLEGAFDLVEQIRKAHQHVSELATRKSALGLK